MLNFKGLIVKYSSDHYNDLFLEKEINAVNKAYKIFILSKEKYYIFKYINNPNKRHPLKLLLCEALFRNITLELYSIFFDKSKNTISNIIFNKLTKLIKENKGIFISEWDLPYHNLDNGSIETELFSEKIKISIVSEKESNVIWHDRYLMYEGTKSKFSDIPPTEDAIYKTIDGNYFQIFNGKINNNFQLIDPSKEPDWTNDQLIQSSNIVTLFKGHTPVTVINLNIKSIRDKLENYRNQILAHKSFEDFDYHISHTDLETLLIESEKIISTLLRLISPSTAYCFDIKHIVNDHSLSNLFKVLANEHKITNL